MVKYTQEQALDSTFKALADGTRRAVLLRLAGGPSAISELADEHDMTLAGMLKHVRVLEDAGMVRSLKHGRRRICEMRPESCDGVSDWISKARRRWDERFDSMERFLEELDDSQPG